MFFVSCRGFFSFIFLHSILNLTYTVPFIFWGVNLGGVMIVIIIFTGKQTRKQKQRCKETSHSRKNMWLQNINSVKLQFECHMGIAFLVRIDDDCTK